MKYPLNPRRLHFSLSDFRTQKVGKVVQVANRNAARLVRLHDDSAFSVGAFRKCVVTVPLLDFSVPYSDRLASVLC